jgi:hypothetical protein
MKIVREDIKVTKFGDVKVGAVFIESDVVFMKTLEFYEIEEDSYNYEEEHRYQYNAISLGSGEFARFVYSDMVRVCNDAQLVVN